MTTFFMFGKYSAHALRNVSADRTREAEHLVARFQGTIKEKYVLLGQYDLVLILDLPGFEEAMRVSTELTKLTDIHFTTCPALSVSEFDIFAQVEE